MAVWVDTITPAPGSTVTYTGIPFEPVAVMFWGLHNPINNVSQCFGATSGPGEEWVMWMGIRQQTSTYQHRRRELRDDSCILIYDLVDHTTIRAKGTLVSLNSDGFSVAFTGSGETQPVFFMAIGGLNISEAHAGTFLTPAGTGTLAVTDPGFKPKALVVAHQLANVLNTQLPFATWGLGFADGINQFSSFALAQPLVATGGDHIQRTDAVICGTVSGSGAYVAELASFDANGFTIDVVDGWVGDNEHGYLAIDCAKAVVGFADMPDSTGVVQYDTPGLEPGGVLFGWNGADAPSSGGSSVMPVRPAVGGMDGVFLPIPKVGGGSISGLHRASAPFGAYQPLQRWRADESVHLIGAGSQVDVDATTVFEVGQFFMFDEGFFQLDWTIATANNRQFGWLALPGEVLAYWIPHIYRRVFS